MTEAMTQADAVPRRPDEGRALFNPALISLVLREMSSGFVREAGDGMPVAYSYILVPAALHTRTRTALPRTIKTPMSVWTSDQPGVLHSFAASARALTSQVSSGIIFGQRHQALVGDRGTLKPGELVRRKRSHPSTADLNQCLKAAHFLGRWVAQESDVASVFAFWGVRP